jgi:Domain of unknown function (DUF4157)
MTSKRIAQSDRQQKSETSQGSGILQRVAVRSVEDVGVQSTDDQEALALSNSAFSKDFSQVPISTTTPAQMMTKLMINPVEDKNDVVQRYQKTDKGKLSKKAELLVTNNQELYASEEKLKEANQIGGQVEFEGGSETQEVNKKVEGSEQKTTTHLKQVQPKVKKETQLYKQIYGEGENKGWDAEQDIKRLVVELENQVYAHVNREDDGDKEEQAKNEIPLKNNSTKTKEKLKKERSRKVRARVLELAGNPESRAREALKEYLVSNMKNLSRELLPSDCRALAHFILGGKGVEEDIKLAQNKPGLGLNIQPDENGKGEWPFHYAAIIMSDGQDHVTLENAAAKESQMYSKLQYDRTWYFEMYGKDTGQTFQNKYQADFNQSGEVKKFTTSTQLQRSETFRAGILQKKEMSRTSSESMNTSGVIQENKTGLPDNLKAGIENLSSISMDDVKVHYNSSKPAQLQALAYTQGQEIYVGSGQERHLAHEAWHVVQQKQGRVKPTMQMKGVQINDDEGLEKEADVMGAKAMPMTRPASAATEAAAAVVRRSPPPQPQLSQHHATEASSASTGDLMIQEKSDITRNGQVASKEHIFQAKFVDGSNTLTKEEVSNWYSSLSISDGAAIPEQYNPILAILAESQDEIKLQDFKNKDEFIKYLKERENDYRPQTKLKKQPIPGTLSIDKPGSLEHWSLGKPEPHGVPSDLYAAAATELTHVTYKAGNLNHAYISSNHGSNPGEFGHGFYLTTGHETRPQQAVSNEWGDSRTGKFPKDIVRFRIANTTLGKIVDEQHLPFLIYMLQSSSGYPEGMSEDSAVEIMNQINIKGRVLIFPDDKEKPIKIDEKQLSTWSQYTQNRVENKHFLVIGPQKPTALAGIRQIAVRGEYGDQFINIAKRSYQKLA